MILFTKILKFNLNYFYGWKFFPTKNPFQWYNLSSIYTFFVVVIIGFLFIYYILCYEKSYFFFFFKVLRDHQVFVLNHMISVGSQIVAHTLIETGNGPNKPNTINL